MTISEQKIRSKHLLGTQHLLERERFPLSPIGSSMFSGFDNLAEGFKRFSLDALQTEEEANEKESPKRTHAISDAPVQPPATVALEPIVEVIPSNTQSSNEVDEWDWGPENLGRSRKPSALGRNHAAQQRSEARAESFPTGASTSTIEGQGTTLCSKAVPIMSPEGVYNTLGNGHTQEQRESGQSGPGRTVTHWNVKVSHTPDKEQEAKFAEQQGLGQVISLLYASNPVPFPALESSVSQLPDSTLQLASSSAFLLDNGLSVICI